MTPFIPLRKVDAARRLVYGQIDETPDRSGEVFDYDSSKPYFSDWSRAASAATGGKSLGNIRAMHGAVAAGKLDRIDFDDAAKSISLVAHIVDDDEWEKVEQGVYTGFSPGGRYIKRWQDNGLTRYTAQPSEISIVDLPCIPSAGFTMVKADGAEERRSFRPTDPALAKAGARNSKDDLAHIQTMHDTAVSLGARCQTAECDCGKGGDLGKAVQAIDLAKATDALRKVTIERDAFEAELIKRDDANTTLSKRVAELEALPIPGGPLRMAMSKSDEMAGTYSPASAKDEDLFEKINAMPDGIEKSRALIKLAHLNPLSGGFR